MVLYQKLIWFYMVFEGLFFFLFSFQAISEFKKGKVEYRADKTGIVHLPFGKVSFSDDDLIDNFLAAVVSKPYCFICSAHILILSIHILSMNLFFTEINRNKQTIRSKRCILEKCTCMFIHGTFYSFKY